MEQSEGCLCVLYARTVKAGYENIVGQQYFYSYMERYSYSKWICVETRILVSGISIPLKRDILLSSVRISSFDCTYEVI